MKQLCAILCCLVLLLSCCSCTALPPRTLTSSSTVAAVTTTSVPAKPLPYDEAIDQGCYYYQDLCPEQKENYDALYDAIREGEASDTDISDFFNDKDNSPYIGISVTLPNPLSEKEEIEALYHAVLDDHPDIFYVLSFAYEYVTLPDDSKRYTKIALRYFLNAEQRTKAAQEIALAVSELTAGFDDPVLSEYDKELLVHDRLLERCRYDQDSADLNELGRIEDAVAESFSAYGALCKGLAVCEGYTRAMMLLLNHMGIHTVPVYNDNHVWNLVWIDGAPYHLDATWNDQEDAVLHSYFNVTDEELLRGREIHEQTPVLPECTATDGAYFIRTDTDLSGASREEILGVIALQMEQYDLFELRFSADGYETALALLDSDTFFDEIYSFVSDERLSAWSSFYTISDNEMYTIALFI